MSALITTLAGEVVTTLGTMFRRPQTAVCLTYGRWLRATKRQTDIVIAPTSLLTIRGSRPPRSCTERGARHPAIRSKNGYTDALAGELGAAADPFPYCADTARGGQRRRKSTAGD